MEKGITLKVSVDKNNANHIEILRQIGLKHNVTPMVGVGQYVSYDFPCEDANQKDRIFRDILEQIPELKETNG